MIIHVKDERCNIALNLPNNNNWRIYTESVFVWLKWDTEEKPESLGYSNTILGVLPEILTLARALNIDALLVTEESYEDILTLLRYRYRQGIVSFSEKE